MDDQIVLEPGTGRVTDAQVPMDKPAGRFRRVDRRRQLDAGLELLSHGVDTPVPARDTLRRRLLALADVAALLAAFAAVVALDPASHSTAHHLPLLLLLPIWIISNKALHLYDRDANVLHTSTLDELPQIVQSVSVGCGIAVLVEPLLTDAGATRGQLIGFWVVACAAMPVARTLVRMALRRLTAAERVLLIGAHEVASVLARKIADHPELGATVVGYVDSSEHGELNPGSTIPHLGDLALVEEICRQRRVDRVIIGFSASSSEQLLDLIRACKRMRLKVSVVPRLYEVFGHAVDLDQVEGMTLLGLRGMSRTKSTLMLKRCLDLTVAVVAIVVAAPLLAAIAIAIRIDSPGRVLFVQRRVGRDNKPFPMFKFRSMHENADALKAELAHLNEMRGGVMFKIADDPRVTRVGRLIRKTSLDELPQLLNVLRGEMSLVGPRPLVPSEDGLVIGAHRARLALTPGLTGPWQVLGRNRIPFQEMIKLDYIYVAEWTLWNDVKLMLRTLPVMVARRGA